MDQEAQQSSTATPLSEAQDLVVVCDGCDKFFQPNASLFHCVGHVGGFDLCLSCALNKPELTSAHQRLETCIIDAFDKKRTFIPGPSLEDFRAIVSRLKESPALWKLPRKFYLFFHQAEIEGVPKDDLASEDRYESISTGAVSAATKMLENDYSIYSPLDRDRRDIRLAFLAPGKSNEPLMVILHAVSYPWSHNHPYLALSYTWGSMDETRSLWMSHSRCREQTGCEDMELKDGVLFRCTAHLEKALRAIRNEEHGIHLWIDALCINQGDLDERAHQISLMADIYGRAMKVGIWLGEGPETEEGGPAILRLAAFLERLQNIARNRQDRTEGAKDDYIFMKTLAERDSDLSNTDVAYAELAPSIDKFFTHPWFSRAWVVQEVWAARSIVVMCGRERDLSWESVMKANAYLDAHAEIFSSNTVNHDITKARSFISIGSGKHLWRRFMQQDTTSTRSPLLALELLYSVTLGLKATDQRDLVFSILAMCVETHGSSVLSPLIAPDYTKPVWQVFSDFTRWYMMFYKSLSILGHAANTTRGYSAGLGGLVPSWSISPDKPKKWLSRDALSDREPYRADADIPLNTGLIDKGLGNRHLITQGFQMDRIKWIDNRFFFPIFMTQDRETIGFGLYPLRASRDFVFNPYSCGVEWLWKKVCELRLVGGCDASDDEVSCKCQMAFDEMLDAVTCGRWMIRIREKKVAVASQAKTEYELLERSALYTRFASHWVAFVTDPSMKQFCGRLRKILLSHVKDSSKRTLSKGTFGASYYKSLCLTESGAMGVCHPDAREGDLVAVLFGCRTPVILTQTTK